jgi:predicted ATPase
MMLTSLAEKPEDQLVDALIGRDLEFTALTTALESARSGRGGMILVSGEAGIGKTRLVRAALDSSRLHVLDSGAGDSGGSSPYAPLASTLRAYLRSGAAGFADSGPLADCLAVLLPELGPPPSHCDRSTFVEAIRAAFAAIAREHPTVVFLDDLHWADAATLELLPVLSRELSEEPLVVVGAYRSDDLARTHPLRRVRSELRRNSRMREIAVMPLSAADTGLLGARTLGRTLSPNLIAMLFDQTQGLPFFVEELAVGLVESGRLIEGTDGLDLSDGADLPLPDTVRDAILLRTEGLSDAGRDVLEAAAVLGVHIDLDLVDRLVSTADGFLEVIEHGLLLDQGNGQATFRHALTREVIYSEVPWPRRRALHRGIAAAQMENGNAASVVAEHWLAGREFELARVALLCAATSSIAVHAYPNAAQSLRRAL